jgi:hypothetical protein
VGGHPSRSYLRRQVENRLELFDRLLELVASDQHQRSDELRP